MGQKRGQTTAEYAIVLGVVIGALVAMQVYVKRGLNARLKDASDQATRWAAARPELGIQGAVPKEYSQYEPYYASSTNKIQSQARETRRANKLGVGKFERNAVDEKTTRQATSVQTTGTTPP